MQCILFEDTNIAAIILLWLSTYYTFSSYSIGLNCNFEAGQRKRANTLVVLCKRVDGDGFESVAICWRVAQSTARRSAKARMRLIFRQAQRSHPIATLSSTLLF